MYPIPKHCWSLYHIFINLATRYKAINRYIVSCFISKYPLRSPHLSPLIKRTFWSWNLNKTQNEKTHTPVNSLHNLYVHKCLKHYAQSLTFKSDSILHILKNVLFKKVRVGMWIQCLQIYQSCKNIYKHFMQKGGIGSFSYQKMINFNQKRKYFYKD